MKSENQLAHLSKLAQTRTRDHHGRFQEEEIELFTRGEKMMLAGMVLIVFGSLIFCFGAGRWYQASQRVVPVVSPISCP